MITHVDKVLKDIRAILDFDLFKGSKMALNFDWPNINKITINFHLPKVSKNDHQYWLVQSYQNSLSKSYKYFFIWVWYKNDKSFSRTAEGNSENSEKLKTTKANLKMN